ncbi:MAG: low molecular weight phosphotyrosine protein phosphatase [Leptospiraceae bacterium]|nr:low molecular weight phosphotyrosine protein phosphatase [Leptospiraceae bacterium]MCP5502297.1 low molecular weight phosphotyrosine protein phosphatase [Leptospiraceae bacterium]
MEKKRVLFVCLGNICRSPAAEGAFTDLVQKSKLESKFIIDSAGTGEWHIGELSHPNTRKTAKKRGIELIHRARLFTRDDFDKFDYILAMDSSNLSNILAMARNEEDKKKVFKFRRFDPEVEGEPDVPDPYYGGLQGFSNVQEICERTSKGLLDWILKS